MKKPCLPALVYGDYHVQETGIAALTVGQQVIAADQTRVGLWFSADVAAGNVLLSLGANTPAANGMTVNATNSPVELLYRDAGILCQQAWYVSKAAGSPPLTVWTLTYQPLQTG